MNKNAPKKSPASDLPILSTDDLAARPIGAGAESYPGVRKFPHVLSFAEPRALAGRRFGVGAIARGGAGNRVIPGSGGAVEKTEGPWAYAYGKASVIDCAGGTGAEIAANRRDGVEWDVAVGDLVEIDGVVYRIDLPKFASAPELVAVARRPEAA